MGRIFITGSADGLGQLAAKALVARGHEVVLHARNESRGREAMAAVPGAAAVLTADLAQLDEVRRLAADANAYGRFDAVIHNAGVYTAAAAAILNVNVLAPYLLTALMEPPQRLVYLSSGMHRQGRATAGRLQSEALRQLNYSDSKLYVLWLCKAVARHWPEVFSNAVDPGWVPTKMGGAGAPDDLQQGYETQVWLAEGGAGADVSGNYFHHQRTEKTHESADDRVLQEKLLTVCAEMTGVRFG